MIRPLVFLYSDDYPSEENIMIIRQFFIPGIAHSSYLIGGTGSCLIVDPSRDTDRYIEAAAEEHVRIVGILETHLHADFISGHRDLAARTGAPIYMPAQADCTFPHIPVRQGSVITMDDIRIEVRETPGHTPEHVSYVLIHLSRSEEPVAVFCGDTLFVGDVGRPDLFPGKAHELASALFTSLHTQLMVLPDHCEVYPAHAAGSLCGKSLGAKRWSTIGYEKQANPLLLITERDEFVKALTTEMPPVPDHFSRCSEVNRSGPTLLTDIPAPSPYNPHAVHEMIQNKKVGIIDTRRYDAFGGMHILGSLNIDAEVNFSTFAGWVIDPGQPIIIVSHHADQAREATLMMHRVGIDQIEGFLTEGVQAWALSGYETGHIPVISVQELAAMITGTGEIQILDVRTAAEYTGYHIPDSIHIPWADLRARSHEISATRRVAVICGTGVRSGIACSILKRSGISEIFNVAGGYSAWIAAGYQ